MSQDKTLGEQNYASFAKRYAAAVPTKPHNAYYDRPATWSLVGDVTGKAVLDVGCGPGLYAEMLVEAGAEVTAFDVTPEMVALARERLGDTATVVRANLEARLPWEDGRFDLALAPLVLDYIEDWHAALSELYRVVATGGALVFSAGHPFSDFEIWREREPDSVYFERELMRFAWGGFGEPRPVVTSYRRPLSGFLQPLLDAGWRLETLLEPKPTQDYARVDPEGYAALMRQPCFLCVRAHKP